jgi:hypothetical protein
MEGRVIGGPKDVVKEEVRGKFCSVPRPLGLLRVLCKQLVEWQRDLLPVQIHLKGRNLDQLVPQSGILES